MHSDKIDMSPSFLLRCIETCRSGEPVQVAKLSKMFRLSFTFEGLGHAPRERLMPPPPPAFPSLAGHRGKAKHHYFPLGVHNSYK